MAIRIYCDCGRKLSVSDDQAGRKTVCPVCGGSVGVPKPGERKPLREPVMKTKFITREGAQDVAARPLVDPIESQVTIGSHVPRPSEAPRRRKRRRRTAWWGSLLVPADHLSFLAKLGLAEAAATVIFLSFLHADFAGGSTGGVGRLIGILCVLVLPVFAVGCEFLSHVVAEASRVGLRKHRWIALDVGSVTGSLGRWLLCLAAGPAFIFAGTVWYWTVCGELRWVDRLILFEGLSLGGGWLAFGILLTSGRSLSGVLPGRILAAVWRLGMRSAAIAAACGATVWLFVMVSGRAMTVFTREELLRSGCAWFVVYLGTLSAAAVTLDLLGGWYAQFGEPLEEGPAAVVDSPPIATPELDPRAIAR